MLDHFARLLQVSVDQFVDKLVRNSSASILLLVMRKYWDQKQVSDESFNIRPEK